MQIKDNEKWETLGISNDFIFSKLMREQEKFKQGIEQGIKKGMINQIKSLQKSSISNDEIINEIKDSYGLREEEIKKYL